MCMYSFLTAFLRHLCRIARAYGNGSAVHALSSFFFTKLKDEGPAAVAKWTNNVDVFSMDIIFVPITMSIHHSLCAVVNPGAIVNAYKSDMLPEDRRALLLHMDSLLAHEENDINKFLFSWLNYLWREHIKGKAITHAVKDETEPFNSARMAFASASGTCGSTFTLYGYFGALTILSILLK